MYRIDCLCCGPAAAQVPGEHGEGELGPGNLATPRPLCEDSIVPGSPKISSLPLSSLPPLSVPTSLVPTQPIEPGQLVVDSDSEEEEEAGGPRRRGPPVSMHFVGRVRRHLSRETLRQKARSAVGPSQQELERRAELKRHRHKRIQEELRDSQEEAGPSRRRAPEEQISPPQQLSSTTSSASFGSLRLSYTADQLQELLSNLERDLAQDPTPSYKESHATIIESACSNNSTPLGLRSHSPAPSFVQSSENSNEPEVSIEKAEAIYLRRCSSTQNAQTATLSGADLPRPAIVHLYDMDIHRQLATRAFNTPDPSPTPSELGEGSVCEVTPTRESNKAGKDNGTEEDNIMSDASSVYPSEENNRDPSPIASSCCLPERLEIAFGGNSGAMLSPGSTGVEEPCSPQGAHQDSEDADSKIEEAATGSKDSDPLATQTTPTTPRKHPRPGVFERTIQHFHLGSGAPPTIGQRFQGQTEESETTTAKPSLFSRLHLAFPRKAKTKLASFDGASPTDERTAAPPTNSPSEDIMSGKWQKAVREEAFYRKLHEASHERRVNLSNLLAVSPQSRHKATGSGSGLLEPPATPVTPVAPVSGARVGNDITPTQKPLPASKTVGATGTAKPIPASWAKFSSCNRAERNASAGIADGVIARDFATQTLACLESGAGSPRQQLAKKGSQASLAARLGKAVKSGLSKLAFSRSSPVSGTSKAPLARDHGVEPELEYPEFGLPAENSPREIHALRHEVHELKEFTPRYRAPLHQHHDSPGKKVMANSKMATILRTDGVASENNSTASLPYATPVSGLHHATPAPAFQRRGQSSTTTTGATERSFTPFSTMPAGERNNATGSSSSLPSVVQQAPPSRVAPRPPPFSSSTTPTAAATEIFVTLLNTMSGGEGSNPAASSSSSLQSAPQQAPRPRPTYSLIPYPYSRYSKANASSSSFTDSQAVPRPLVLPSRVAHRSTPFPLSGGSNDGSSSSLSTDIQAVPRPLVLPSRVAHRSAQFPFSGSNNDRASSSSSTDIQSIPQPLALPSRAAHKSTSFPFSRSNNADSSSSLTTDIQAVPRPLAPPSRSAHRSTPFPLSASTNIGARPPSFVDAQTVPRPLLLPSRVASRLSAGTNLGASSSSVDVRSAPQELARPSRAARRATLYSHDLYEMTEFNKGKAAASSTKIETAVPSARTEQERERDRLRHMMNLSRGADVGVKVDDAGEGSSRAAGRGMPKHGTWSNGRSSRTQPPALSVMQTATPPDEAGPSTNTNRATPAGGLRRSGIPVARGTKGKAVNR